MAGRTPCWRPGPVPAAGRVDATGLTGLAAKNAGFGRSGPGRTVAVAAQ